MARAKLDVSMWSLTGLERAGPDESRNNVDEQICQFNGFQVSTGHKIQYLL